MYINKQYMIKDEYPTEIKEECLKLDNFIATEDFNYYIQIDFIEIIVKAHYMGGNISEFDLDCIYKRYGLR